MRTFILYFSVLALLLSTFIACKQSEKIPNKYEVTATFHKKTIPAEQALTRILQFNTPPEMATRTNKVSQLVSDINVTAIRTEGNQIPPFTAFVSQTFFRREGDLLGGFSGVAGNREWLRNRTGDIAICSETLWLEHGAESYGYQTSDSTVNLAHPHNLNTNLQPVYREAGASFLTTFTQQTMYIPWEHPDVPDGSIPDVQAINSDAMHLDMRMLSRQLFDALSGALTTAVDGMSTFSVNAPGGIELPIVQVSLGGADGAGEFRLHYLPQIQFNEQGNVSDATNQPIRGGGIGFYFEGTIDLHDPMAGAVPFGNLRVIIPAFLIFEVTDNTGDFQVELQPTADLARGLGAAAMGMDKIVVLSNTPLGVQANTVANSVRNSVRDALLATANDGGATGLFVTSTIAFSSGVNKYRKRPAPQIEFDVVLLPDDCNQYDNPLCFTYNGLLSTQVQPETDGSTRVSSFIMGR